MKQNTLVLRQAKAQSLLAEYAVVSQLNSERCLQLERAHSLASQFWETYVEMWPWLQETLSTFTQLPPPAIEYDTLRQQQEELRVRIQETFVCWLKHFHELKRVTIVSSKCGS